MVGYYFSKLMINFENISSIFWIQLKYVSDNKIKERKVKLLIRKFFFIILYLIWLYQRRIYHMSCGFGNKILGAATYLEIIIKKKSWKIHFLYFFFHYYFLLFFFQFCKHTFSGCLRIFFLGVKKHNKYSNYIFHFYVFYRRCNNYVGILVFDVPLVL